jgi:uracil-DNA glycosylase
LIDGSRAALDREGGALFIMSDFASDFVATLATSPVPGDVANPYAGTTAAAVVCRDNLRRFLTQMTVGRPAVLLVGEAPGYRGCRLTGVPFTSEEVLRTHASFGANRGYHINGAETAGQREATATILWQALDELALAPLLWNAYPFHPHRPGEPLSNRPPRAAEVRAGEPFLRVLLAAYAITTVIAVGRVAARALAAWDIAAVAVRHPAHGGAAQFRRELATVVAGLYS